MSVKRGVKAVLALLLVSMLAACKGPSQPAEVSIVSINLNPGVVAAGAVVQVTGSISAPGQSVSSLTKHWAVTNGTLRETAPDFALLLRGTAKAASESFLDTTNSTVYWVAPTSGAATITLTVSGVNKSRSLTVGASPITMSVTNSGASGRTVTVMANAVTDLYQAAFRINFTSNWKPTSAQAGDFLGAASGILFLGLTNQSGFVPCAITRKGNAAGVDGSGTLATINFDPTAGTSAARELSAAPFELSLVMLRNSGDQPINVPAP